ncbi:MAG TPA: TRAP transporter small permease [Burkholderiaceae bacterium]
MSSASFEDAEAGAEPLPPGSSGMAAAHRLLRTVNGWVMVPCMLAIVAASAILSYSVAARYFFKIPTEWQDETAVFLLIGATFLSGAFVQSRGGHIGVEAIAEWLSPRVNRWRQRLVDVASMLFCAFFAWKSWSLFLEALHEGHTSNSTWGPPLWIPYLLMACGMTLLAVQLVLQVAAGPAGQETLR